VEGKRNSIFLSVHHKQF